MPVARNWLTEPSSKHVTQLTNYFASSAVAHLPGNFDIPSICMGFKRHNADGVKQVMEYLDHFGLTTGVMLSFNFNKHKESGVRRVSIEDLVMFEATV